MKLHVTETYFDRVENKYVEKESIIERDDERARKLISVGVAEEMKDIPEESSESEEDAPKQRTRKSAKK